MHRRLPPQYPSWSLGSRGRNNTWGPTIRIFGLSCVRQVYFLCKSKEFHYMRTECQINIPTTYFSQFIAIAERYMYSLPYHTLIANRSLPVQILLHVTIQFLILLSGYRCRPVFLYLDFWSCTVKLFPCLRGWKLELSFNDSLSCSRSLFSEWTFRNISYWRSIRLTLQPQPTKRSASYM